MSMSPAQLAAVKADILANPDLNAFPNSDDGAFGIAAAYNVVGTDDGWSNAVDVNSILNAIDYTKYTPADAVPTDTALNVDIFRARADVINIKQMNLQNLTIGKTIIDCSRANIRSSLRDAVINVPAGTAGANVSAAGASGVNITSAMTRKLTRLETLLATAAVATGSTTAKTPTWIGPVGYEDIRTARNS